MKKDHLKNTVRTVLKIVFGLLYRVRVNNIENIPDKGAAILCPNHVAELDMFVIGYKIERLIRWMAKAELFKWQPVRWFITRFGAFPVKRGKNDVDAMKTAMRLIDEGHIVGIFPEGTRMKSHRVGAAMKIHLGAVMLALKKDVPVIPAGISGNYRPFTRITVNFGQPFNIREEYEKRRAQVMGEKANPFEKTYTKDEMREIGRMILDRIYSLTGNKADSAEA